MKKMILGAFAALILMAACTSENGAGLKAADLTSYGYMVKSWYSKPTGFQLNHACPPTSGNPLRNLYNGW